MLKYTDFRVNYSRPFVWRRPMMSKLKPLKTYMGLLDDNNKFLDYRSKMRNEVVDVLDKNVNVSEDMNSLSMRMADLFDHLSRSLIFDNDIDPTHLLKHTNKVTLNKKLQPWCSQLNGNIDYIIQNGYGILGLINKLENVPAFVVAAGPSLINNIKELRKVGNKGLIVSTDTAFRHLLDAGIEPHIVMAHDANHNGAKFFLPKDYYPDTTLNDLNPRELALAVKALENDKPNIIKDWHYNTVAAFVNYISPLTIRSYCGDTIMFYAVWDDSLPVYHTMAMAVNWAIGEDGHHVPHDKGAVLGGSSVGHTAFYLANSFGCNPISLMGLDLSYPGGKTYIEGASNQKDISKIKLVDEEDLSGRLVKTNVSMFSYKTVFEKVLPQIIMQRNISVYNCTEAQDGSPAGILEEGAEPKRVSWVIENYCKQDIPNVINIKDLIKKDREVK